MKNNNRKPLFISCGAVASRINNYLKANLGTSDNSYVSENIK
jgi:hypothetical protein